MSLLSHKRIGKNAPSLLVPLKAHAEPEGGFSLLCIEPCGESGECRITARERFPRGSRRTPFLKVDPSRLRGSETSELGRKTGPGRFPRGAGEMSRSDKGGRPACGESRRGGMGKIPHSVGEMSRSDKGGRPACGRSPHKSARSADRIRRRGRA